MLEKLKLWLRPRVSKWLLSQNDATTAIIAMPGSSARIVVFFTAQLRCAFALLLTLRTNPASDGGTIQKFPELLFNNVLTDVCRLHSGWAIWLLRRRFRRNFSDGTFVALAILLPGDELAELCDPYWPLIATRGWYVPLIIRKVISYRALNSDLARIESHARWYQRYLGLLLDLFQSGKYQDMPSWFSWHAAPPPLVGGERQLQIAQLYRKLEAALLPHIPVAQTSPRLRANIRVGLFRYQYDSSGEVDLLSAVVANIPKHIEFHLLGFGPAPVGLGSWPYSRLDNNDIKQSVTQARSLELDVVIYSPPLWGQAGSKMACLIENRIAPMQVYYLGDVSTSGLCNLDYFIFPGDVPAEEYQAAFSEKLLPVANGAPLPPVLFADAPGTNLAEAQRNGVTFVTNSHAGKFNTTLLLTWAKILSQVPNSKIMLFPFPTEFHRQQSALLEQALRSVSRKCRIDRKRFIVSYDAGPLTICQQLTKADVYLDSFPYCGAFSVAEALRAGLPGVTLISPAYHGQLSRMITSGVGITDAWMVRDIQAYIDRATALGVNAELRRDVAKRTREMLAGLSQEKTNMDFSTELWKEIIAKHDDRRAEIQ